jgi:hypothetical protein
MTLVQWLIPAAIVGAALAGLYLLLKKKPPPSDGGPPYRRRDLLSGPEQKLYGQLVEALQALGGSRVLLCKVRLSELLAVDTAADDAHHWHHELDTHVVDFLICSAGDVRPLVAVETTADGGDFLGRALGSTGIKLLRLDNAANLTPASLKQMLKNELG